MLLISMASGAPRDPRERGLYVDDDAGLIPEHLKADLHLQASALEDRFGGAPLLITAASAPEGEAERLRRAWSLPPEDLVILVVAEPLRGELAAGPPGASGVDGATRARLEREVLGPSLAADGPAAALSATLTALDGRLSASRAGPNEAPPQDIPRGRLPALAGVLAALALASALGPRLIGALSFDSTDPRR